MIDLCKYCNHEIKIEHEWLELSGSYMHASCDQENTKRISEHKCVYCNTDLLEDYRVKCKDYCDGKYTCYPGYS